MSKTLYIIGAGGHGKVAAECAELLGCYDHIFFLDDAYPTTCFVEHWKIHSRFESEIDRLPSEADYFIAIGNSHIRQKVGNLLNNHGLSLVSLKHPSATVSQYVKIGKGCLIAAGATINPFVTLGIGSIVNTNASIDHDCVIGDWVHVAPNATLAGSVTIGNGAFIGAGATVIQGKTIGENTIVGAATVVLSNLPSNTTAVGVPARALV